MATNKQKAAEKKARIEAEESGVVTPPKDAAKLVEAAIKNIKKDQGVGFARMKDKKNVLRPVVPTGIFALDHYVLGSGGLPRGRIVEIFGAPSGGKGTLTSQIVAHTQKINPKAEIAYIDAECAFDHSYAASLGVDTDNLLIAEPDYGEQALQAALDIITTGGIHLAVVDSVAALVPKAELEGEMADSHVGLQARMLGQALRKLTGTVSKTNTCLIFINQTRAKIGVSFGEPSDTPGGKALKFFSSVRLSIDRLSQIKEKEENVGNRTKMKAHKNKTAVPFRSTDFNLMFDMPQLGITPGFDGDFSLVEMAIEKGVWLQDGKSYTLASTGETVNGKKAVLGAIRSDNTLKKITQEATLLALGKTEEYIKRSLRG